MCAESQFHVVAQKLSGTVTLLDMLKRYAFSFYEVVIRIEQLRREAQTLGWTNLYSTPTKVYPDTLKRLSIALTEMRAECNKLDLVSTIDLISHIESTVNLKGKDYNHADMLNHLDTLSSLFDDGTPKE